jgi:mannosidase alpha-like ER degradation enhancer 2
MWDESIVAINQYLQREFYRPLPGNPRPVDGFDEFWYGHADMNTGARRAETYGALDAFFPAVLALSGEMARAIRLQRSSFDMWNHAGIEPEEFDYREQKIISPGYPLRPEIVESTYYLYHYTKEPRYLQMGEKLWRDFVQHCRTDVAYAALKNVVTKEKSDSMQSFLFAETFKYFYLLFAPPGTLNFDRVVFNTEAHPIRKFK